MKLVCRRNSPTVLTLCLWTRYLHTLTSPSCMRFCIKVHFCVQVVVDAPHGYLYMVMPYLPRPSMKWNAEARAYTVDEGQGNANSWRNGEDESVGSIVTVYTEDSAKAILRQVSTEDLGNPRNCFSFHCSYPLNPGATCSICASCKSSFVLCRRLYRGWCTYTAVGSFTRTSNLKI